MNTIRNKQLSLALLMTSLTSLAQAADDMSINGKWFAYPGRVDPSAELPLPVPEPVPEPPLKPEFLQPWRELRATIQAAEDRGEPIASGYTQCLPDGMPTMMQGMFPMEVLETSGQVTIIQEAYNQVRRIYLDEEQLPWEEAEPRFWGHSVASWEGDTLVVDTVGIKESVMFRNAPHSAAMKIQERIHLVDDNDNYLVDEVTIIDPEYLTAPWSWTWMFNRNDDYKLYEYVCENNREYADPETGEARLRLFGE